MGQYASGRHSWSLCDRCGFRFRYLQIRNEPGTAWRVCSTCNDGAFNLVSHPQNKPPPVFPDPQSLRYPRPDVNLVVGSEPNDEQQLPMDEGGPGGP
jgi:hypothetical protein